MKTLQPLSKPLFVVFTLTFLVTVIALSQGRTIGRTRNPEELNTGGRVTNPVQRSDESRGIGQTRSSGTSSVSTPAPRSTEERNEGRTRSVSQPVVTEVTPPPTHQPHSWKDCRPIVPPQIDHCVEVIWIDAPPPQEVGSGYWIREAVRFGTDVALGDFITMPQYSGYDFSELLKRPFDHPFADMYVESDSGSLYMVVREDSDIMDIGKALVPVDAIFVPQNEWSADHSVCLFVGHEYVVRTWDRHYAKILVKGLLRDRVIFDWAYQYGENDREEILAMVPGSSSRAKFSR